MDNDIETIESIDAMVDEILGPDKPAREEKTYLKICANCGIQFRAQTRGIKLCPECRRAARSAAGRKGAEKAHGLRHPDPSDRTEGKPPTDIYVIGAIEKALREPERAAQQPTGMTREQILDAAKTIVCGAREEAYGSPEDSFAAIAAYWTAYLRQLRGPDLTAQDVAMMMILLKVARQGGRGKLDNLIDIAGYAACGGEIWAGGGQA